MQTNAKQCKYFNPRPPWGGRLGSKRSRYQCQHFNPRPPWGGRRSARNISRRRNKYFNPRPPWGGRRTTRRKKRASTGFQSTPSVGRATRSVYGCSFCFSFQSTPSVGRATEFSFVVEAKIKFQSTPSVGRATYKGQPKINAHSVFQSTPSVGRATSSAMQRCVFMHISIHALRGEGDGRDTALAGNHRNFNPRPPWGGRQPVNQKFMKPSSFQSTPSVGRATGAKIKRSYQDEHFNPRPPWGGRRPHTCGSVCCQSISIHALRGEGDCMATNL